MNDQDQHKTPPPDPDPAHTAGSSGQSAEADLKKLAANAKSATQGFDFNKLFEGRLDQMNYFYGVLLGFVLGYVLMMIPVIGWIASIPLAVISIGMSARRFRDIGITGWAGAAIVIPMVNVLVAVYLSWKHGDAGANVYGAAPDPKREMFRAILNT